MTNRTIQRDAILRHEIAPSAESIRSESIRGIVQRIDIVQRELTVLTESGLRIIDVPVGCSIFLHGERIKLRLIQPRDRVNIRLNQADPPLAATVVQVQPDVPLACCHV